MEYRPLGSTGKKVSVIGLGCEHLDGKSYAQIKSTVDAALSNGVNIFDVFMPGREVREHIAKALGSRRSEVRIQGHIGSTNVNKQYDISRDLATVKKFFNELLELFGYIDFGMMFFIDSEDDYRGVFETGFVDYVRELKADGKISHIGFSSHNPETAAKVIATGLPEMMMFSINPAFDMLPADTYVFDHFETDLGGNLFRGLDPKRAELYRLCDQQQVGITVMKTLGAGKLTSAAHSPFAKPLSVAQCIHYALSRPAVGSVMLGCQSAAEVEDAMRYFSLDDASRDYAEVLGTVRNDFRGNCVYCSHCQPCPVDIDIATVNKYLDIARLDAANLPPALCSHYQALPARGADCIACGSCESRCPFGVPVIENMAEAERLMG